MELHCNFSHKVPFSATISAVKRIDRKEAIAVKNFFLKYAGVMAAMALVITTMTANSTCICLMHQDELPEAAKKLRKI